MTDVLEKPEASLLGDAISKMVAEKLDAAFVEKVVDKRVAELVEGAVKDALQSYSDTGRLIKKAVEEALVVNRLDLPSYGAAVAAMLKAQIEARVSPLIAGQLAKDMDDLLSLAPKEVKLSYIAEKMIEHNHHSEDAYGDMITVIVERSDGGYAHVYLDEDSPDTSKYSCPHSLAIDKEGKIYSSRSGGKERKDTRALGPFYGIDQLIRAYVACGTKIILDEDAVVIGRGDY